MALLPEELHKYSHIRLTAMSDLLVEIIENLVPDYPLPAKFVQSLEDLRGTSTGRSTPGSTIWRSSRPK